MIEWKVTVNKRVISRDTEEDVALTPSAFWPVTLRRKLEKLLEGKTARKGRVRPDDTSIVVSVNNRSQRDLTKQIQVVEKELSRLSKKLKQRQGKYFGCKLRNGDYQVIHSRTINKLAETILYLEVLAWIHVKITLSSVFFYEPRLV